MLIIHISVYSRYKVEVIGLPTENIKTHIPHTLARRVCLCTLTLSLEKEPSSLKSWIRPCLKVVIVDATGLDFFHVNSPPIWYYGDPLGWQFPSNIDRLVFLLHQIQTMSGLTIMCNIRCELLHDPSNRDKHYTHTCGDKFKLFDKIQTFSNVFGAVSILITALLSQTEWLDLAKQSPNEYYWFKTQ